MAVFIFTSMPKKLLRLYKTAIDERQIETWSYDADGDFSHTPDQWLGKAWMRPKIDPATCLILHILSPQDMDLSSETYGVYHGRFVESVLTHFDKMFTEARITAMPVEGDHV